jgi:hypothetical protein
VPETGSIRRVLRTALLVQLAWIVVGAALLAVNTVCSGERCTEGEWFGTVIGLVIWGIIEVPILASVVFASAHAVLTRLPR